jgi:N-acetylglucosamine-6-phosphate deacetylase
MSEPGRENTGGARDGGGWWLLPDRLFDGTRWRNGRALHIEAGRITAIIPQGAIPSAQTVVRTPLLACPGFVDLQVNGGGGVMFNNDPSPEALAIIGEAHRRLGTTAWLPTFITDTADRLDMAVDAVIATMGRHGVAGMHIEGPHINVARKGTHSAELIRPFDARTMASARRLCPMVSSQSCGPWASSSPPATPPQRAVRQKPRSTLASTASPIFTMP